ncbi:hypothetical protein OF83DRAFT_1290621 [Amylostereum chailletii]|nr:hypothetical protein OF83DRAFT_1290621 [Amylostereum chailletii]
MATVAPPHPLMKPTTARNSKEKQPRPKPTPQVPVAPAPPKKDLLHVPSALADAKRHQPPPQPEAKKLSRRSSKPIFDWFHRKLAGTVRARRASETGRGRGGTVTGGPEKRRPALPDSFNTLARVQSTPSRGRSSGDNGYRRRSHGIESPAPPIQPTVSLDDDLDSSSGEERRDVSTYRSSLARESMWSPTSNLEADDDASVRPLPPSSPPSPSPSRSSSSYLSDPRTFRSLAASTKPTTLLSVDLANGMAHIAQAPLTPGSTFQRLSPNTWSGAGSGGAGSISFSALPVSATPSQSASNSADQTAPLQAPQHTTYHPRNNPRPSSPPLDNASVLTLASYAFGIPGSRPVGDTTSISQLSHFGGSRVGVEDRSSHFGLGEDLDVDKDWDASVRALRPRSSRRSSWESEASGWSAKWGNGSTMGIPSTPSALRDRSIWTSSIKTGQLSTENADDDDDCTSASPETKDASPISSPIEDERASAQGASIQVTPSVSTDSNDEPKDTLPTPKVCPATLVQPPTPSTPGSGIEASVVPAYPPENKSEGVPADGSAKTPEGSPADSSEAETNTGAKKPFHLPFDEELRNLEPPLASPGDAQSMATSEANDVWHSAPSTPLI